MYSLTRKGQFEVVDKEGMNIKRLELLKTLIPGAEEIVQWFRGLALAEDLVLIPTAK